MKTVEITVDDNGAVMVGMPPETEEGISPNTISPGSSPEDNESSYMQPAKSVDEALQMAKDMLTGPSPEEADQAQDDFNSGYEGVAGKPPMPQKKSGSMMM